MPEERGLYPGMRVLDQLEYLGRLHGIDAAAAQRSARRQCERLVEELTRGGRPRLAVRVAGDPYGHWTSSLARGWWTLTLLVARRELSERINARSFRISTIILVIGVA